MTALQIDTEASRQAARTWSDWADRINAMQMQLAGDSEPLWLTEPAMICATLAGAATELWTLSGFMTLLVDQLEAIDGGAPMLHDSAIDELMWLAGDRRGPVLGCSANSYSGPDGDTGTTFDAELRTPYDLAADHPIELGRQLIMRALQDTGMPGRVRKDEFELVQLSDGRYLVALPGVIDLTHFGLGHDDENGSVRDLDQSAVRSSMSTSVADNAYAQMVSAALEAARVPKGSELVIVGHSFGADTALDLAADAHFNGPSGYRVTHVVAAGYDSRPQLDALPASTRVLVLQNRSDIPVLAESVGHAGVTEAIDDAVGAVDSAGRLDSRGVVSNGFGAVFNTLKAAATSSVHVASRADDVAVDMAQLRPLDAVEDAVFPQTGTTGDESQVVSVFDAGWKAADGGHDQARYIDFVENTSDPLVLGFFGSLAMGAAVTGTVVAVDVSVPEKRRDAQKT